MTAKQQSITVYNWSSAPQELWYWNFTGDGNIQFGDYTDDGRIREQGYYVVYDEINDVYFRFQGDCITSGCWDKDVNCAFFNDDNGESISSEELVVNIIKRDITENYVVRKCYLIDAYFDNEHRFCVDWESGKLISDKFYWSSSGKCYLSKEN